VRYSSRRARIVLFVAALSAIVAARAQADSGDSIPLLAVGGAELADIQRAAAGAAQEARFVESVRELVMTSGTAAQPELEALDQRLKSARRRLQHTARRAREAPASRTPFELALLQEAPPSYDDRLYAVLAEQRALRAEATAVLHAARDVEKIRALALELERAHAAQARASHYAQTARAGRARLHQIIRTAARAPTRRELELELQGTLASAIEAAEQARVQATRARAALATLRRLTGTRLESAPRMIAAYERAFARVRAALHDLYADWERIEPLNHMAASYRVQEALRALPPDASAEDVRNAVLAAEADPPMAY
jgi:hypothetical protein